MKLTVSGVFRELHTWQRHLRRDRPLEPTSMPTSQIQQICGSELLFLLKALLEVRRVLEVLDLLQQPLAGLSGLSTHS